MAHYALRQLCDFATIWRRRPVWEYVINQPRKAAIDRAVAIKAVQQVELERLILESTIQSKIIAQSMDWRLLETA